MDKTAIRALVRGAYDLQKLRMQMGLRLVNSLKAQLGQAPGEKEADMERDGKKILTSLRQDYKRITDGVAKITPLRFKGAGLISDYTTFALVSQYLRLVEDENQHFKHVAKALKGVLIFDRFLEGVHGVGPAMAGVIISEIDITRAVYPSSLWKYAGLDVAPNGAGRSRKKEHLEDVEYTDKNGEVKIKKGITFNPFLKTKLVGVLGPSFLKSGPDKSPYAAEYYNYRNRLENHPDHKKKTKGHRHNMAIRYAVKRFLVDLYREWRALEGLPFAPEYSKEKLGMNHKAA